MHVSGLPRSDSCQVRARLVPSPLCCETSSSYSMQHICHMHVPAGIEGSPRKVDASQMLCLHDGHRMYSLSSSSIALLAMEELLWERMQCPLCHMTADTPSTVHVEDNAPVAPARLCCACAGTRAKQTQHCAGVVTGQRARPCERRPAHAAMQAHAFLRRQTLCQQCSDPFTSARLRLHTARQHYAVFAVCIAVGDVSQQPG